MAYTASTYIDRDSTSSQRYVIVLPVCYSIVLPTPPPRGGSAILASTMVTIQAVVVMVTVPVAMETGLVAMEI